MTLFIPAALGLLALAVALLIEDSCRRSWKRSFRRERQWNHEHHQGTGQSPYDLERAYDTRKVHP